jgi:NAD(P)-dependent dehydrogenase (short-subunit alcohol dehydrogenase family)
MLGRLSLSATAPTPQGPTNVRHGIQASVTSRDGKSCAECFRFEEESIAALGKRLGAVHHVVSTASARARGRDADLDRDALRLSFGVKVLGPLMLAEHLAPRMSEGGSFVIFSGVAATSSPSASGLPPAISRAASPAPSRYWKSSDSTSSRRH